MPDNIPKYSDYPPEVWKDVVSKALAAMHSTMDPNVRHQAAQAVQVANDALNQYGQESVDATKFSSIPGELNSIANGFSQGATGFVKGIEQLAQQVGQGDTSGVWKSLVGGLGATARGIAAPVEAGAHNLATAMSSDPNAEYMPESIVQQKISQGAGVIPGLMGSQVIGNAVAKPIASAVRGVASPILSGMGGIFGRVARGMMKAGAEDAGAAAGGATSSAAPSTGPTGPSPVIDPNLVDLTRNVGRTPKPAPVEDINLPRGGPTVPDYMPNSATPPPPPGISMESQLGQAPGGQAPPGFEPTGPNPLESIRTRMPEFFNQSNTVQMESSPASSTPPQPMSGPQGMPGFMGTGPESIDPADLAKLQVFGQFGEQLAKTRPPGQLEGPGWTSIEAPPEPQLQLPPEPTMPQLPAPPKFPQLPAGVSKAPMTAMGPVSEPGMAGRIQKGFSAEGPPTPPVTKAMIAQGGPPIAMKPLSPSADYGPAVPETDVPTTEGGPKIKASLKAKARAGNRVVTESETPGVKAEIQPGVKEGVWRLFNDADRAEKGLPPEEPVEGEVVGKIKRGGKSVTFGKGVRPGFKAGVKEALGEMARTLRKKPPES